MDGYFAVVFLLAVIFFFVSLVAPRAFKNIPYLKTLGSRKKLAMFFGLVALFSFILLGITTEPLEVPQEVAGIEPKVLITDNIVEAEFSPEQIIEAAANDSTETTGDTSEQVEVENDVAAGEPALVIDMQAVEEVINTTVVYYKVDRVVDGDTIDVIIDGKVERLRLIGIDTPETVHPNKPVECYGIEASNKAKSALQGSRVSLEADPSQGDKGKYGRLLRYVFLEDGSNFNLAMIQEGYAYEYTYDQAYKYQSAFKAAEQSARENKRGLWGDACVDAVVAQVQPIVGTKAIDDACSIKGNISSSDEKIFHVSGCDSYPQTRITESKGERWFCTEQEALDAGWRKALNCN